MTRDELIEKFRNGDIGEVEFVEVALDQSSLTLGEINQVLTDVRVEDGIEQGE
jgi:hypothetical protein